MDSIFNAQIDVTLSDGYSKAGEAFRFDARIKNISRRKWDSRGENPVRLSYHLFGADNRIVLFEGERISLRCDLDPEREVTLTCLIPAPEEPGSYTLEFDLVQEFVAWFKDQGSSTARVVIFVNNEISEFQDYQKIWESAKLSENYWSVVGPGTKEEFDSLGKAALGYLIDLGASRESRILDVGCGTGSLAQAVYEFLGPGGLYYGTDVGKRGNWILRIQISTAELQVPAEPDDDDSP